MSTAAADVPGLSSVETTVNSALAGAGGAMAPGSLLGPWVIDRSIGEGSMGRVYRAHHAELGRQVALKVLRTELLGTFSLGERFLQEGRAVNHINHPHLIEVYDFVHDPAGLYCVMELLEGETLAERMLTRPSTLESIRVMGQQLASALGAAHDAGVIHRDLKPENIFLVQREGRDDWVKVLDFGVAKVASREGEVNLVKTQQGMVLGTPRYMSPEQMAAFEVDARSDIYSLGTILYELLSGRAPFEDTSFGLLAAAILTRPAPELPPLTPGGENVPEDLAGLIAACLAKQPSERPQSMALVEQVLVGASLLPQRGRRSLRRFAFASLAALSLMTLAFALRAPAETPQVVAPQRSVVKAPVSIAVAAPLVTLSLMTVPKGAWVFAESGELLGRTPLELKRPRAEAEFVVRVELPGHRPVERALLSAQHPSMALKLQPLVAPKVPRRPLAQVVTDDLLDSY
jgi:serine/threonine-protein kinase